VGLDSEISGQNGEIIDIGHWKNPEVDLHVYVIFDGEMGANQ
jgi:hypothetical protein